MYECNCIFKNLTHGLYLICLVVLALFVYCDFCVLKKAYMTSTYSFSYHMANRKKCLSLLRWMFFLFSVVKNVFGVKTE